MIKQSRANVNIESFLNLEYIKKISLNLKSGAGEDEIPTRRLRKV